jgi:hypothetical protein
MRPALPVVVVVNVGYSTILGNRHRRINDPDGARGFRL